MNTTVDFTKLRGESKPMPKGNAEWVGRKPDDLIPGIEYEAVTKVTTDSLIGEEIVIVGYSLRDGDKGEFAVVCCVPKTLSQPAIFTIGGAVVLRKLKEAGKLNAFPVVGKLAKEKGKKSGMSFYDFVSDEPAAAAKK
jgi:hypothetical protein